MPHFLCSHVTRLIQALVSSWLAMKVFPKWPLHPQDLLNSIHLAFCCWINLTDGKDLYLHPPKQFKLKNEVFIISLFSTVLVSISVTTSPFRAPCSPAKENVSRFSICFPYLSLFLSLLMVNHLLGSLSFPQSSQWDQEGLISEGLLRRLYPSSAMAPQEVLFPVCPIALTCIALNDSSQFWLYVLVTTVSLFFISL